MIDNIKFEGMTNTPGGTQVDFYKVSFDIDTKDKKVVQKLLEALKEYGKLEN